MEDGMIKMDKKSAVDFALKFMYGDKNCKLCGNKVKSGSELDNAIKADVDGNIAHKNCWEKHKVRKDEK